MSRFKSCGLLKDLEERERENIVNIGRLEYSSQLLRQRIKEVSNPLASNYIPPRYYKVEFKSDFGKKGTKFGGELGAMASVITGNFTILLTDFILSVRKSGKTKDNFEEFVFQFDTSTFVILGHIYAAWTSFVKIEFIANNTINSPNLFLKSDGTISDDRSFSNSGNSTGTHRIYFRNDVTEFVVTI